MGTHRYATSQMHHNQIQLFIMFPDGSGIFTRYRLTVQGMEDGNALYLRYSRQAGGRLQLVYHFGIGNVGGTMAFPGYFIGNQRAQITGVLHPGVEQIVFHLFVNGIHPAGRRLQQTATGNDGIKIQRNIRLGKQSQYKVLTVRILFVDVVKLRQVIRSMMGPCRPHRLFIDEKGYFGRSRARINHKYFHSFNNLSICE